MKTLKYEEVYLSDYNTFDEALDHIVNFIRMKQKTPSSPYSGREE